MFRLIPQVQKMIAGGLLAMALLLPNTTPAHAAPERAPHKGHLLILAKDGAFAGNLWSLAGRSIAIDRSDARLRPLLTGLTDAHGWLPVDRNNWRAMDVADAAARVCRGELAAVALIAEPDDGHLAAALTPCNFRLVDLGDGISRAHAAKLGLHAGRIADGGIHRVSLGATTLVLDDPLMLVAQTR